MLREAERTSENRRCCCQRPGDGEMSHGLKVKQSCPLRLPATGQTCGSTSLVLPHRIIPCPPTSTCRQEFCQLNKKKTSPTKYMETLLSVGNGFLQPRGLSQKPSQHFLPVWVPELRSNCIVTCCRHLAELFTTRELILLKWNCFASL